MANTNVRKIIENRLKDNWNKTKICYENVRFLPKRGAPYISLFISEGESSRKSFKCVMRYYTVMIEVRTEKNTSTILNDEYCDELNELFKSFMFGNFTVIKSYTQRIGRIQQWYQKNVVISCKFKEGD